MLHHGHQYLLTLVPSSLSSMHDWCPRNAVTELQERWTARLEPLVIPGLGVAVDVRVAEGDNMPRGLMRQSEPSTGNLLALFAVVFHGVE